MFNYIDYIENEEMTFNSKENNWITFLGEKNKEIYDNLTFKNENDFITINSTKITKKNIDKLIKHLGVASYDMLDIFLGETISDELAYNLESLKTNKKEMQKRVEEISYSFNLTELDKSPVFLSISEKVKLSIARVLISNPKVLVLNNLLSLLDKNDLKLVIKNLKNYIKNGGIIFNFTSEIEETLLGSEVVVTDSTKVIISGKTISVLNEEKLMKRLGYNLPFIILLNKYLKDYELINRYYLDYESLVNAIWL